jgi:FAD/FMN-containing dehydrogenase
LVDHTKFHKDNVMNVQGNVIERSDSNFENVLMGTLFNKIHPGRMPDTIVEPKSIQDIIETIRYAKLQGKQITVCSGGHSWSANHLRNNSILLKMSHFNTYEINAKEMTAKAGPAVAGSDLLLDLYKQKLFFPAGHCKGVCIGGYLLQGGFGWHGRKLGMACENVIGLDLVTADGEYIHASKTENADVFWAARGSGGGFFGVVVCFHLKLHPLPPYRGIITQNFDIKHLEEVYAWAYEIGQTVSDDVEFQMIMSNKTMMVLGAGIEVAAPIFANTKDEYHEAARFMLESPIKKKARIALPSFNPGMKALYNLVMTHYPENHHWGVDNMWTDAPFEYLLPHLKEIAKTLPPPPSHILWLNWHPTMQRQNMAFSTEDRIYIALYSAWKDASKTAEYGDWATSMMQKMSPLSSGIQLADENLHKRTAPFVEQDNLRRIAQIRAERDPHGLFHEWHSKPELV